MARSHGSRAYLDDFKENTSPHLLRAGHVMPGTSCKSGDTNRFPRLTFFFKFFTLIFFFSLEMNERAIYLTRHLKSAQTCSNGHERLKMKVSSHGTQRAVDKKEALVSAA